MRRKIHPPAPILEAIRKAKTFLLAAHVNPEADAVGSMLALGLALEARGKKVTFYLQDPVPSNLQFLPGVGKITHELPPKEFDVAIITDVSEKMRVGQAFARHRGFKKIICVDHHAVGKREADLNLIMPNAAASGIVVYHLLKALGVKKIPLPIAMNLYCAVATDTGSFRYSNTNAEALEICAELLEAGVDAWKVARPCFETNSHSRMELLQIALKKMTLHGRGKIALMIIRQENFRKAGASFEDSEGLVDYARTLQGVEVAVCMRQVGATRFKMSLRSNDYVNVAALAQKFGGGGHIRAAGCDMEGSLAGVKRKIIAEITQLTLSRRVKIT